MGSFGQIVREKAYWMMDAIKGKPVKTHYQEIKYYFEHPDEVADFQEKSFQKLAEYAIAHTKFYADIPSRPHYELSDFPIIDKNIIKANHEKICSPKSKGQNVIAMHTSGSTGTPLVIYQDKNKRNRVYAEMQYMWGLAGYKIGMRYMFLRRWTSVARKSKLTAFARNLIMQDVTKLDDESLEAIYKVLRHDKKIQMLLGYASTLDLLVAYFDKRGASPNDFGVKTILSGSEVLTEKTRRLLKKVFGCTVVSLYSNQENGMLAIECPENKEFHLNNASFIFEILKVDSDEPAEVGEVGRIVITDLFNYAMPIIRYDTGDLTIKKQEAECAMKTEVFTAIEGRRVDVLYDTSGKPLSPHTVTNGLWEFDKLKQFQLVQHTKRTFTLNVNDPDSCYTDDKLVDACKGIFGSDAVVEINRVVDIPLLASGKFKYLICEIKS